MSTNDLGIAERLSRSRGRTGRDQNANARLTKKELEELKAAAKAEGKALGEWNREVLLQAARGSRTDTALFTELIAFRLFANNILRNLALGQTMTPEAFAQILAEVRANKHDTARDLLTTYQNPTGGK